MKLEQQGLLPYEKPLLDVELFDDDDDAAVSLLVNQVRRHGVIALHPDGIVHDPMPPIGARPAPATSPRKRKPQLPQQVIDWLTAPPGHIERQAPLEPIVERLPPDFRWLIGSNQWISQAEIERFWIARRTSSAPWVGWGATRRIDM